MEYILVKNFSGSANASLVKTNALSASGGKVILLSSLSETDGNHTACKNLHLSTNAHALLFLIYLINFHLFELA